MNATISVIVVGIVGLFSGVAGAALLGELRSSQTPRPIVTERVVEMREAQSAEDRAVIQGLQRELLAQKRALSDQHQQREAAPVQEEATVDPAQMRREREQEYEMRIQGHLSEQEDTTWAAAASASLRTDLGSQAEAIEGKKFVVTQAQCRSRTCVAELDWENFDAALAGFSALLSSRYTQACSVETVLAEPSDRSQRYGSKMLFTCR